MFSSSSYNVEKTSYCGLFISLQLVWGGGGEWREKEKGKKKKKNLVQSRSIHILSAYLTDMLVFFANLKFM